MSWRNLYTTPSCRQRYIYDQSMHAEVRHLHCRETLILFETCRLNVHTDNHRENHVRTIETQAQCCIALEVKTSKPRCGLYFSSVCLCGDRSNLTQILKNITEGIGEDGRLGRGPRLCERTQTSRAPPPRNGLLIGGLASACAPVEESVSFASKWHDASRFYSTAGTERQACQGFFFIFYLTPK